MPMPKIIAIDGPAASGKSTVGKKLADDLGYLFFDTGVMYRAVTLAALEAGISVQDADAITELAENVVIEIRPASLQDGRNSDVLLNKRDITWSIRKPEVDQNVSLVSSYSGVRKALTAQQRRIGQTEKLVMVGRDIGTVVLPEADIKIFLDASAEERALRRFKEQSRRENPQPLEEILSDIYRRDLIDSTRMIAPLHPAADAIILNTDGMDVAQVVEKVITLVHVMAAEDPV
jgi:cytidylate kinase